MPDLKALVLCVLLVLPLAILGWRYFKSGSLAGAILRGRITQTVGEVSLPRRRTGSCIFRVSMLEPDDGGPLEVALSITRKNSSGTTLVPIRLTRDEARELAVLLQKAGG